ncbi:MAG: RNA methyltransferase [Acidobacteriota bacterium]
MADSSFLYGFHPIRELLRHRPHDVVEVWFAARPGKRRAEIEGLCKRHRISVRNVDPRQLDERSGGGAHNGFAALSRIEVSGSGPSGDPDFQLLVEDIQDPRNLGALLRVCESAGVSRVLVRDRGSAPLSATATKTSAGASEWLDIERVTNSAREIDQLKKEGFWVYGADAAGVPPWELDLTGPVLVCIGGEGTGLRERTKGLCDGLVGLPMRGKVESLNLATAASAILYEALRQRLGKARLDREEKKSAR